MKTKLILNSLKSQRQELDINLFLVLGIGLGIALSVYAVLLPLKNTFLGILLYERGFTQILTIIFAGIIIALTVLKFFKVQKEYRALKRDLIAPHFSLDEPHSNQVINLQQDLAKDSSLLASRCSRVLAAYVNSGSRQIASEFALEDSAFYQSASEHSYVIPKILIWAIPLLGFIGTVMGISASVGGFTQFLEKATDIDQIKEGIGTVTQGLAIAFDTTLLALFLSILAMLPLVLVERLESRLLLAVDIYINGQVLPRLKEKEKITENLNAETVERAVANAVQQYLPTPETLIEPAKYYAEIAATSLAKGFTKQVGIIQEAIDQTVRNLEEVGELTRQEHQKFFNTLAQQIQTYQALVHEIRASVGAINNNHLVVAEGFKEQTLLIAQQLEKAGNNLENRVKNLEKYAAEINEIEHLQRSLAENLRYLKDKEVLEEVLKEIHVHLAQLKPILEQLNKPRKILLLEQEDGRV